MSSPLLLTGIGFRTPHYATFLESRPGLAWLELQSEHYFCEGGKSFHVLEKIRKDYPISLHGAGLSLGSTDDLNWQHLTQLRELINRIRPCLISEHLSWSSINGHYLHDLLPLPFTDEALKHIVSRIQAVQDYLSQQILIENISSYIQFNTSTYSEVDFLKETAIQSGCGILLDINNIYVTSTHAGFNPYDYIASLPSDLIQEIHLAGHAKTAMHNRDVFINSHDHPVSAEVWKLYQFAIQTLGCKPTIIEWDNEIPTFEVLHFEAGRAEKIMRETYAASKLTNRID